LTSEDDSTLPEVDESGVSDNSLETNQVGVGIETDIGLEEEQDSSEDGSLTSEEEPIVADVDIIDAEDLSLAEQETAYQHTESMTQELESNAEVPINIDDIKQPPLPDDDQLEQLLEKVWSIQAK
jgi:hypothetical protein